MSSPLAGCSRNGVAAEKLVMDGLGAAQICCPPKNLTNYFITAIILRYA